ncbi:hypothetical protein M378DRAFT_126435 [Amanita muscaria Koide BX008]|uniref:Uncharacterized protein n=1 Tax=Amanita muscaria (strain Koide BX008) TaxID=946122 RepID=A0A0C2X5R2_AMAMK|nr:hypothetical protein M378DRAFT_126435 [Amanita muscaria Koide BX008]
MPAIFKVLSVGACLLPFISAFTFIVYVGKNEVTGQKGLGFDPSDINPVVGDIVSFTFASGTHSVVQSTFDHPCTPINGGYNSGSHTVDANIPLNDTTLPVGQLYINDTIPQWFFDQASGQCQQGAVMAVNPTVTQNVTAFKANAAQDTTPATSSTSSASGTSTSTASSSKKTNAAVVKFDVAVGGLAVLLGASLSAFLH